PSTTGGLGKVWVPLSAASVYGLELIDFHAPQVPPDPTRPAITRYNSIAPSSYADMIVAPDGAFWLVDFGNNRIVRWVPGADTETYWNYYPPPSGRLNPAQIDFDEKGWLWITERSANRVDHFDPTSNNLY